MTATAWDSAATTAAQDTTPETLALQLRARLRAHLQALAPRRLPITYQQAAKALLLSPPNTIQQVTQALEQIMTEDAAADRPFIAAMVISKTRGGVPAPGFFHCAARLGRFASDATGLDACAFHAVEINAAFDFWGPGRTPARVYFIRNANAPMINLLYCSRRIVSAQITPSGLSNRNM